MEYVFLNNFPGIISSRGRCTRVGKLKICGRFPSLGWGSQQVPGLLLGVGGSNMEQPWVHWVLEETGTNGE